MDNLSSPTTDDINWNEALGQCQSASDSNWGSICVTPGNGSTGPLFDQLGGPQLQYNPSPAPQCNNPPSGTTDYEDVPQTARVGSSNTGAGVLVQTDTLTYYIDQARSHWNYSTATTTTMIRAFKPLEFVALAAMCVSLCLAIPGEPFSLQKLVAEAGIIVIADIDKIRDVVPTNVPNGDEQIPGRAEKAEIHVQQWLKGFCPTELSIDFDSPSRFIGYPGVALGRQILFLKQEGDTYRFSDRHYPSLPAAPGSTTFEQQSDILEAVIEQLGGVLSSSIAPENDKWIVLARAYGIPKSESFRRSLEAGLETGANLNLNLRYRIQAELVRRGSVPELSQVVGFLQGAALNEQQREMFLLAIRKTAMSPTALPVLRRLVHSRDVVLRRVAAEALWHSALPDSVPDLIKTLEDSDQEVRFYAVRALSDIVNEPGWGGPSEREFQEHQDEYIRHWRDWAKRGVH